MPSQPGTSALDCETLKKAAVHVPAHQASVKPKILDQGTGPVVVFLHGLLGLNRHWNRVIERLVAPTPNALRCVCIEIPLLELAGRECSVDGITRLCRRVLEEHVREPAIILGSSIGGHAALRLALDHAPLVRGLVLAGSSGLAERKLSADEVTTRPTREWLATRFGVMFHQPEKHLDQSDVERVFLDLQDRRKARAFVKLSKSARDNHLGEQIGRIRCPTLVLWGREDAVTPPEAAEQFAAGIPGAELVWIEDCGHAPMVEAPEAFAGAVRRFADRISPAT